MGCLAWLLAMGGIGGASLVFALNAPTAAWWVLGLIVLALLAGPHAQQWWRARSGRTRRMAADWWAASPDPIEVAFVCGGPDRVVDLVVADMVAEGQLKVDDEGRLGPALTVDEDGFRREIHNRLSYGNTDLGGLRFSARPVTAVVSLWRTAVRRGLLLPAWRREYTHWYVAGAVGAIGFCVAVALARFPSTEVGENNVTFVAGLGAVGLALLALWRPKFLVGYGFDPRTAAGLRAAKLARAADRPDDRRHQVAVRGIRSMRELDQGAPGGVRVPESRWHVPWYARRVHEPSLPWWHEVAQATTDYASALGESDGGGHGDLPD